MNRKKELIKNTLILMLGQISGQAISFLMLPIYTTYLKPKDYGLVDLISILSSVLAPTLLFQLNMGSFRFLIDARNDREKQKNIISSVMIAILLLLLIYMPLGITVGFAFSIEYINLILASIFSSMVYILFLQFARGLGKNNLFSVACLIDGVVLVISNILFIVTLKMGAQGMILSSVISNIIATLYLIVATDINNLFCKKSIKKNTVKEIVKYSLPLVPNGISWWAVGTIDKLLVSFFLGLYKNGIYAIANKFAIIFNCIYYVFSLAWVESSSLHIKDTDNQKYISNVINESFRFFGLLSLIIISFCKLAFMIMINKQYNQSLLYVPILVIGALMSSVADIYNGVYIAKKETKKLAYSSIIVLVINTLFCIILIPKFGLYAAAISTVFAYSLLSIYRYTDIKKIINIDYKKETIVVLAILHIIIVSCYYINNLFATLLSNLITIAYITVLIVKHRKILINYFEKIKKKILTNKILFHFFD